jgi:hypothetical protein
VLRLGKLMWRMNGFSVSRGEFCVMSVGFDTSEVGYRDDLNVLMLAPRDTKIEASYLVIKFLFPSFSDVTPKIGYYRYYMRHRPAPSPARVGGIAGYREALSVDRRFNCEYEDAPIRKSFGHWNASNSPHWRGMISE